MKKSIIAIALILSTGALSAATVTTAKRDSVKKSFTKKDVGTADLKKSAAGTKKDVGTAD